MGEKKVTVMVIKVDLDCEKCRKKIKKVLCDIPQIQNQVYDEKANTVTITVICCNPEKIKKKICCKGGKTIKGIEIKVPEKPKEKPPPPKEPEKPKGKPPPPKEPEKPKEKPPPPKEPEKPPPKEPEKPPAGPPKPAPPQPPVQPVPVYICPPPVRACCRECYEGRGGGPCYEGYGRAPPPCYEGYGRPVYESWGGGGYRGPCYVSRCDYYLSEENPQGCSIM